MITTMTSAKDRQIPSDFALPTSVPATAAVLGCPAGAAIGMATGVVCAVPTYVVRDAHVAGDARIAGAFPGLPAWSPPTC
ncbi:MAG TPA: hypothetical protein VD814_00635 [Nocardioides sp.]|nr:hypothetical protein [Nocardioides sp.]